MNTSLNLKPLPKVLLTVMLLQTSQLYAVTFIETGTHVDWFTIEKQDTYCTAHHKKKAKDSYVWIGECNKEGFPYGRGYIIDNGYSYNLYAINTGEPVKLSSEIPKDMLTNTAWIQRSTYLRDFYKVLFTTKDNGNSPNTSKIWLAGSDFLAKYPHTDSNDRLRIENLMKDAEVQSYQTALKNAKNSNYQTDIKNFLTTWSSQIDPADKSFLQNRIRNLEAQAKQRAEEQKRQAIAEQQRKEDLRKNGCSYLYAGYVGKYKRSGWLATADSYVVRYVNSSRNSVTIEGTSSGNTLKYGQYVEMPCYQLLEGSS